MPRTVHSRALALALAFGALVPFATSASLPATTSFDGIWVAPFRSAAGTPVRLVVAIEGAGGPAPGVRAASPDQGFDSLLVTGVEVDAAGGRIAFDLPAMGARFTGTLSTDGEPAIRGALGAGGMQLPLLFRPAAEMPALVEREQTPRPPLPYAVHEVSYEGAGGVRLAGTLTSPPGDGPHPAVVLLGLALPDDREGSYAQHRFYAVVADALTRRGIAVLRSDDRGVGGSQGDYFASTYDDLVADALAARRLVRSRPEIDPARVGFLGWSEGTAIAARAAAEEPDTAALVLLGGIGRPARDALPEQAAALALARGLGPTRAEEERRRAAELIAIVESESGDAARRARLEAFVAADRLDPGASAAVPGAPTGVDLFASRWYRSQFGYEPATTLAKVSCPVLVVTGELDRILPPRENLSGFLAALAGRPRGEFAVVQLAGLNHVLQPARLGLPIEYASIPVTVSPRALATIVDWLAPRLGLDNPLR